MFSLLHHGALNYLLHFLFHSSSCVLFVAPNLMMSLVGWVQFLTFVFPDAQWLFKLFLDCQDQNLSPGSTVTSEFHFSSFLFYNECK